MVRKGRFPLRARTVTIAATCVTGWCSGAIAQEPDRSAAVDLTWVAPPGCSSREEVLAEAAALIGPSAAGRGVSARAEITQAASGGVFRAVVRLRAGDAHEERSFEATTCAAIASTTALILAVAATGRRTASPGSEPAEGRVTTRAPTLATPRASQGVRPTTRLEATAGFTLDDGMLPSVAAGFEIAAGLRVEFPHWRIHGDVGAAYLPTVTANVASHPGESARFDLASFATRACASLRVGPADLGPCVGVEADRMNARGASNANFVPEQSDEVWVAVSTSALATITVWNPLAAYARLDGLAPLARPTFVVLPASSSLEGPAFVHRPAAWTLRATLGLGVTFF